MQKKKVNWTIDPDVLEAVQKHAQKLTQDSGVKVSESATANLLLRERLGVERKDGK